MPLGTPYVAWHAKSSAATFLGMASTRYDREARRLALAVRRRRRELNWTQEDAAHETRMATRHYQKPEAGKVNVTLRTLCRVAEAFELDLRDIFT